MLLSFSLPLSLKSINISLSEDLKKKEGRKERRKEGRKRGREGGREEKLVKNMSSIFIKEHLIGHKPPLNKLSLEQSANLYICF